MSSRISIPNALVGTAFRTSDVGTTGLKRGRLRGDGVQHPFHGVSSIDLDLARVYERCLAFEPNLLEGQVFSHTTALALWGAPLPDLTSDLHLAVAFPRTPPRGRGVIGHSLKSVGPALHQGLLISNAAEAWCQSALLLAPHDLTAAADALLTGRRRDGRREPGLVTFEQLDATVRAWTRRPGHVRLRSALLRARPGVDARPETHLRLLIVDAGLPEPMTDMPVEVEGGLVLHTDLGYPELRLGIEYEGDDHRKNRRKWESDVLRRELMEEAGTSVLRVTAKQLYQEPLGLLNRLARRIEVRSTL